MSFQFEYEKQLDAKDKRIAELEARDQQWHKKWEASCETLGSSIEREHAQNERIKAMTALLDKMPHDIIAWKTNPIGVITGQRCVEDCPACAWDRLKACE